MTDLLRKMEALVREDCKPHVPGVCYIRCYSYAMVSGNIEAHFDVGNVANCLYLYDVIYIQESNQFCMYRYRLEDMFCMDNSND